LIRSWKKLLLEACLEANEDWGDRRHFRTWGAAGLNLLTCEMGKPRRDWDVRSI